MKHPDRSNYSLNQVMMMLLNLYEDLILNRQESFPYKCSIDFSLCIECIERLLIVSRVFYVQPALQLELKSDIGHDDNFFQEALFQHQPNTYLTLLGLDPIDNAKFYRNERREVVLADSL